MSLIDRILDLAALPASALPAPALAMARLSLFDWLVCGRAGINEPLAAKLRRLAEEEAGNGTASVFGGAPAPARMAALVNGATSHALDYDDTHFGHVGHPSVAIFPAALATAEEVDASAPAVVEAFLSACHGLYPWDGFGGSQVFDGLLLPGRARPEDCAPSVYTTVVTRAAPDGHIVLHAAAPIAIGEALYPKRPYAVKKDFVPVLSTAIGAIDRLNIFCRSATIFEVYVAGKDIK